MAKLIRPEYVVAEAILRWGLTLHRRYYGTGGHLCGPLPHGIDKDPLAHEWSGKIRKK